MNLDFSHLVTISLLILVSCFYWRDWARFKRETAKLEFKIRNQNQLIEALGDVNRWYASKKLGRRATDEEAVMHYGTDGGAIDYAKRHRRPPTMPTWLGIRTKMRSFVTRFPGRRNLFAVMAA